MKLFMIFLFFPIILSALAYRRGKVGNIIGLYALYVIAIFCTAAVFVVGFDMTGQNIYAEIILFVIQVVYYFILVMMAQSSEETLLCKLVNRFKLYASYGWERKWLWLKNIHHIAAMIAIWVITVVGTAVEYWLPLYFDATLRYQFPIRKYTPGRRFFAIVLDFLRETTEAASEVAVVTIIEICEMEWRQA